MTKRQEQMAWVKFAGFIKVEVEEKLEQLKTQLGREAVVLQGKKPSVLKASMLCLIAKERGFAISKTRVAEAYGCTTTALNKRIELLKQLMEHKGVELK